MKVLLVGLGRWGSEVVDRFRFIRKKTPKRRPRDVLVFSPLDPIKKTPIFLSFTGIPSNIIFLALAIWLKTPQMRLSAIFAFIVFLIVFAIINLLMYLLFSFPFGQILLGVHATEKDKTVIGEIKEELEIPKTIHIIRKGERTAIYKFLQFQKKAFFTTLILGVIISCGAAIYFYKNYWLVEWIIEFLRWVLETLGVPEGASEPLAENVLTSIGIPLLLSLALRHVILIYYLPQITQKDLGKKKAEKILRSHVDCVGVSFHDDISDLRYIDKIRIIPEKRRNLKEVLRDQILYYFDKKVTEEGKVYDAVMFFGIAGSDIVQKFSEVSPFMKRALIEPMWFYVRFTNNFLTEEQHRGVKKLLMEMNCVFAEEENGRIFVMSPDEEDYTRVRILERLFAIGEGGKTKSIRAIDVGDIRSMARKNTFSTMAYGYLEQIPEEMRNNEKLMTELYTLTVEERSLLDIDVSQAAYALATVKRQAEEPEPGPIYDYDAIRELLWEKFGENIRVYDIEYVLYNLETMEPVEIDRIGIPKVVISEEKAGRGKTREIRQEIFIIIHEDEQGKIEYITDWVDKYYLIDRLQYKNLLVDDIKRKELWMMFSGIEPEKILDKYMAEAEYEKDFFEMVGRGVVMDPSTFARIPLESLEKFLREKSSYGIGRQYVSPFLFQEVNVDFVMSSLEILFLDVEERRENAEKLISVYTGVRTQLDPIIRSSDSVISPSRVYIHDLLKAMSLKTGMKEDAFSTRILAEMAWLSHSLDVPIVTSGLKGIEPELLSVYRRMAEEFGVEPENVTERFRGVLRDWELSESGIIPEFSDLYLINIHLGYESGEEGIVMTAMEYMGGVSGRRKREGTGNGSRPEREDWSDREKVEYY